MPPMGLAQSITRRVFLVRGVVFTLAPLSETPILPPIPSEPRSPR